MAPYLSQVYLMNRQARVAYRYVSYTQEGTSNYNLKEMHFCSLCLVLYGIVYHSTWLPNLLLVFDLALHHTLPGACL